METSNRTVSLYLQPGQQLPGVGADGTVKRYTRKDFTQTFGPSTADQAKVADFAAKYGLDGKAKDLWRYDLSGSPDALEAAFGVDIGNGEGFDPLPIPTDLEGALVAAFTQSPAASNIDEPTKTDCCPPPTKEKPVPGTITPAAVAELLQFPDDDLLGAGQTIAVLEGSGCVSDDYPTDLALAINESYPHSDPKPSAKHYTTLNVAGGKQEGPDGIREVELDLQLVQTLAPYADVLVIFYGPGAFGTITALATAILNEDVTAITWSDEIFDPSSGLLQILENYCQAAAAVGVTICKGAGDNGAFADRSPPDPSVYALPCIPWILSSGGVMLVEGQPVVWDTGNVTNNPNYGATGGGFSAHFAMPPWQEDAVTAYPNPGTPYPVPPKRRGMPDVASVSYDLRIYRGQEAGWGGGCSATGPVMAAMIARINAILGTPVGFISAVLYQNPSLLQDITQGDNGVTGAGPGWTAASGWDPCTGLGLPNASALLKLFQDRQDAS